MKMSNYLPKNKLYSFEPPIESSPLPTHFDSKRYQHQARYIRKVPQPHIFELIENDFNKKYSFTRDVSFPLPGSQEYFTDDHWEVGELQELKRRLNEVKNKLNNFSLKNWHYHTRNTNHAGEVVSYLKKYICPEFVTQAWCKFYEIVSSFPLVPSEPPIRRTFNSVHLCEAPGAFVTSLNHYLKLNHPHLLWQWLGTTLNPYHEGNHLSKMINDDRFIMHTIQNWTFGKDYTGDLHKDENLIHLISEAEKLGPISLVTADGSIDCQNEPGEQEHIVSSLHYREAVAAMSILEPGGSFVLKIFTVFECETICLLYLLRRVFDSLHVFKPATSKGGNSETYLICLGYVGKHNATELIDLLTSSSFYSQLESKALLSRSCIPQCFLDEILACSTFFTESQIFVLERNINTYGKQMNELEREELMLLRRNLVDSFMHRYKLQPLLDPAQFIVGNEYLFGSPNFNFEKRDEEGSFQDRQLNKKLDRKNHLIHLKKSLNAVKINFAFTDDVHKIYFENQQILNGGIPLTLIHGVPVKEVNCSKFCCGKLINIRQELQKYTQTKSYSTLAGGGRIEDYLPPLEDELLFSCDVSTYPWHEDVTLAQNKAFEDIYNILKVLKTGSVLSLIGLPLLTQFNVGLVYLLGELFEQVWFINPLKIGYAVIFYNMKSECPYNIFDQISSELSSEGLSLITFLPVYYLCYCGAYETISSTNHLMLKASSLQIIDEALIMCSSESP